MGELAATRLLGLTPGRPVVAVRAVVLPHVSEAPGSAGARPSNVLRRAGVRTAARRRLLDDLRTQATRLGALGVCAISFDDEEWPQTDALGRPIHELSATGVPLLGRTRVDRCLFRTQLDPTALARLLSAGWMAADVLVAGRSELRRWVDQPADARVVTGRQNAEIPGATRIVSAARAAVRADLRNQASALGAEGLLIGPLIDEWASTRHAVDVTATADAIVRWRREPQLDIRTTANLQR